MPETLPKGWTETTLGEITEPSRERVSPAEVPGIPYVGLEHIEAQSTRLLGHGNAGEARSSSVRFSRGDVLYARMRPYLNKVWVADFDGLCSAEFLVLSKSESLNSRFLAMRLNAEDFVTFANAQVSGERPRVDFVKLSRFPVLLPPRAEQDRIVAKFDAALSALERAERSALRARERLKNYRSAVLHAAVAGDLTHEWRDKQEKAKGISAETGEALLQSLLAARQTHWEEAESQRRPVSSRQSRDANWKSPYPAPTHLRAKDLPKLPDSWTWANLDQMSSLVTSGSRGWKAYYASEGAIFIRSQDIRADKLNLSQVAHVQPPKASEGTRTQVKRDDLLVTITADVGRAAIVEDELPEAYVSQHIGLIRFVDTRPVRFAHIYVTAPEDGRRLLLASAYGAGKLGLGLNNLRELPIPLPPLAEQVEIVREVQRRLEKADRLAAVLERQLARARETRQALLREALAGRLVAQDPNDEPASLLLEHIRASKIQEQAKQKSVLNARRRVKGTKGVTMKTSPSPESLRVAWRTIGDQTDARRLFDAGGFAASQVIQFYEALRATPEIRTAFEDAAQQGGESHQPLGQDQEEQKKVTGRFRLVELWLENFKNLVNYTVSFDPSQGLDVLLGWNGTGKSNIFEALVIIFRDLHSWVEKNHWPKKPMKAFRLSYEMDEQAVEVTWHPGQTRRPELKKGPIARNATDRAPLESIKREQLPLPRFVFGYYSGPTNRLAEHFLPMKQAHYERLRQATADDAKTLSELLEQRKFFCAEPHHAKYVLLAFSYKEDPKINAFLTDRLRIVGFESALFIIRKPRWAKRGTKPADFWGATGIMRRVMERLRRHAIAPMVVAQKVNYGYRSATEDHYYFLLPDLKSLHAFAAEYADARTFFVALESTDFSELIHDVKIQVRVRATHTEDVSITFNQLSEGEQQLLMVLGLMRFTKSHQSLVLLDEPDTHLNPHWSIHYLKDLTQVMADTAIESSEQQTSQILMATHDPLVIASLIKQQIYLLKRDYQTGACKWFPANVNPRGLGFTGILTSEMFGFRSDLDPETLSDLDTRVRLVAKEGGLSSEEKEELAKIDTRLSEAGFSKAFSDPYYAAFVRAWGRRYSDLMAGEQFLTQEKRGEIERIASEVLKEAVAEVEKEVAD